MRRFGCPMVVLICLFITGFPAYAGKLKAFVSITPQQYFVQRIGGSLVDVSVLVPTGADPHSYEPKPKQMAELAKTGCTLTTDHHYLFPRGAPAELLEKRDGAYAGLYRAYYAAGSIRRG